MLIDTIFSSVFKMSLELICILSPDMYVIQPGTVNLNSLLEYGNKDILKYFR